MGLSKLWELQEMQLRLQELQRQLQASGLARELKREKQRLETCQETVRARMQEREELRRQIASLERACQDLAARKKQLEGKLYSGETSNPKELNNIQHKIDTTAGELAREEERAMELALQQEQLEEWLKENVSKLQAGKAAYREKLDQYRTWREGLQQEMDVLAVNAARLEGEIDSKLLALYSDLQRRLGTKVLARVVKGTCSGCHLVVPPVLLREARAGKFIYCESCGRLLLP
ncbi:zinc ribbon domain-containing protein [Neomoorella glycerini]|nr:C4-type zinc ribbon domain-containing protein [Moorella glycerini]